MMTCFAARQYSTQILEQITVVLCDWCFVKLDRVRKHLGFRVIGKLVVHPNINASFIGNDWFTSEVKGIYSESVVTSDRMTLYRLEGPAAPARHNAQSRLAEIMQPFCQSMWPPNAHFVLNELSEFFAGKHIIPRAVPSSDGQFECCTSAVLRKITLTLRFSKGCRQSDS
jgi:hypothetical protein